MSNFSTKLEKALKIIPIFVDQEGGLLRSEVINAAYRGDIKLLTILSEDEEIKKKFFTKIKNDYFLNIHDFVAYIQDKNFLNDSYTAFKNKIGLTIDGKSLSERKEVALVWPFKDCVLEGGQTKEDAKRKEIFFNEILAQDEIDKLFAPKVLTSWKRFTGKNNKVVEEKVKELKRDEDGTIRENLIIKGNNLIALHTLKTQFQGKVKLIYIDPPYNTGNDSFGYNDSFNHSTWLTFMRNRLEVARDLMRSDGAVLIHCDFNEESHLKILMDEIFDRNNYLNTISVRDSHPSGLKLSAKNKTIIKTKSSILIYRLSEELEINPIYQARDDWDTHFNIFLDTTSGKGIKKYSLHEYVKSNNIIKDKNFDIDSSSLNNKEFRRFVFANRNSIFQSTKELPEKARIQSMKNEDAVIRYDNDQYAYNGRRLSPLSKSIYNVGFDCYKKEDFGKLLCDFWDDIDFNNSQNEGGISLSSGKKPELLLARLISMFTVREDLVLDFFGGAGTTGAVSHKIGRQYVLIEQMDYVHDLPEARLRNVIGGDPTGISEMVNWKGGGDFVYCELAKYNEAFIENIEKAKDTKALIKIWSDMKEKSFLNYMVKPEEFDKNIAEFKELPLKKQKDVLIELLNKNQLYVNKSDMEDTRFKISKEDKEINKEFYRK
jgi:adenine-specific DNA-methyltransferase